MTEFGSPARIATLVATAGLISAHNLYMERCARFLDMALRAHNSSVPPCIDAWTYGVFAVDGWFPGGELFLRDRPLSDRKFAI